MDERYTRYIENLRRVRALARPEAHAGMKAADLLEEIKQNAAESYTLMQQSNAILDEVIFSRRAENLTEEEAAGLSEFAGKLFNYANSEDSGIAYNLRRALADRPVKVYAGADAIRQVVQADTVDTVVNALVGYAGLLPTVAAIEAGKKVALANKETLVCAGTLVMDAAEKYGAEIVPVDSEHSAIFQCVQGCRDRGEIKRLILTCSGGPFYGLTREQLAGKTRADALRHPNWTMGAKITVDSATLMNKGLEIIEAMRLYRLPLRQVDAIIHRQSIVHSLVEYRDGAMLAQLGTPDMKLPIRYAMTYPYRAETPDRTLDLLSCPPLTFAAPDEETFRCLKLARQCAAVGGTACAILNGANEEAVGAFLRDAVGFNDIPALVEAALETVEQVSAPTLEEILTADHAAREAVRAHIQ